MLNYKFRLISFREIDYVLWISIEHNLPTQKSHTGKSRADMRSLITVHKFHLYLCEHSIYKKIFNELLNKGYDLKKIDLSQCFTIIFDVLITPITSYSSYGEEGTN